MYIPKSEFGWTRAAGWLHGDEAAYNTCVATVKDHGGKPGRARPHPIDPTWEPYLKYFVPRHPGDHTRSQGAFCRWAGIRTSSLSAAKRKPMTARIELLISEWIEELHVEEELSPGEKLNQALVRAAQAIKAFSKAIEPLKDEQQ